MPSAPCCRIGHFEKFFRRTRKPKSRFARDYLAANNARVPIGPCGPATRREFDAFAGAYFAVLHGVKSHILAGLGCALTQIGGCVDGMKRYQVGGAPTRSLIALPTPFVSPLPISPAPLNNDKGARNTCGPREIIQGTDTEEITEESSCMRPLL